MMRVVIAAGNSGGCFYHGLVVARELLSSGHQVHFFVGNPAQVAHLAQRENIPYQQIFPEGHRPRIVPKKLFELRNLCQGFIKAYRNFSSQKPDLVLIMGGLLSLPTALAARLKKIPLVFHEQHVFPGRVSRLLARLATVVAVGFLESRAYFQNEPVVTGNPIRAELFPLPNQREVRVRLGLDPDTITGLVFGGSTGNHRLNLLVVGALPFLRTAPVKFQMIHIAGVEDAPWVQNRYASAGIPAVTAEHCHSMEAVYAAADFVVCRGGTSTLSELTVVQKPALLIPSSITNGNHPLANAAVLAEVGAIKVRQAHSLTHAILARLIKESFLNGIALETMRVSYQRVSLKDHVRAATNLVALMEKVVSSGTYLWKIKLGDKTETRKVVVLK